MTNDLGGDITGLETRLNVVEQQGVVVHAPTPTVVPNAAGTPVVHDPLTWASGWASYGRLVSKTPTPGAAGYPNMQWESPTGSPIVHGPVRAIRIGPMAFLTGLVVRTGATLPAGTHNTPMFTLPAGWRPTWTCGWPCVMYGSPVGIAWVEARADRNVYYHAANAELAQNNIVIMTGSFTCGDDVRV